MNVYQGCAHQLHAMGFNVTAIVGGKRPGHGWKEYQEAHQSLDQVNAFPWRNASGVGVISEVGGLRIFDFDEKRAGYPPVDFATVKTVLQELGLTTAYPWLWRSGSGNGWGLAVLCFEAIPTGVLSSNGNGPGVFEAPGVGFDHLELRWRDCQTLLPPSKHPEGPGYVWQNGAPNGPPATVTATQVIAAFQAVTLRPQSAYVPPTKDNGHGSGYAAAALRSELDNLGRAIEGTRNETLNRCAFALGQLVAGGELDRGDVEQQLLSGALAIGLGEGEAAATIRSGLDAGAREPRSAPLRPLPTYRPVHDEPPAWLDETPTPEEPAWLADDDLAAHLDKTRNPKKQDEKVKRQKTIVEPSKLKILTLRDLLTTEWPEPVYVVNGMLPEGLTSVSGKSKLGKSWLMMQLGYAVACGGMFLGQRVEQGRVLYAALEDSYPWLNDRARKQGMQDDLDAPMDFTDIDSITAVRSGAFLPLIREGKYRLVIIDTLSRGIPGDQNDTDVMTAALSPYQAAALTAHCAVVFVDHHNKLSMATVTSGGAEPDPLLNQSGSIAKGGVADGNWGLYPQGTGKRGALLAITGRRVPEQRLRLIKDPITQVWQLDTLQQPENKITPERAEVLDAIETLGTANGSEIAKHMKANRGNIYKRLQDLVTLGLVRLDGQLYSLPEEGVE